MQKNTSASILTLNLSCRAFNCCMSEGLHSIRELLQYYQVNFTFDKIKNCGTQTNLELTNLCNQLMNDVESDNRNANYEVEIFSDLSVRARNCIYANFKSTLELLLYYLKNRNFKELRNCGKKTEQELIYYCNQFINERDDFSDNHKEQDFISDVYNLLSKSQKSDIDCYLYLNYMFSKPRLKSFLSDLLANEFNFIELYEKSSDINLNKYRNIGKTTLIKTEKIKIECIELVNSILNQQQAFENFVKILCQKFKFSKDQCESYKDDFYAKKIPLFKLVNEIIHRNKIFSAKSKIILFHRFNYFKNEEQLTFDEIAAKIGVTRERVRQLQGKVKNQLLNYVSSLYMCKYFISYSIDFDDDIIIIKDEIVERINLTENVGFTKIFYLKIFHIFGYNDYSVLNEDIETSGNLFLIKRELFDYFDFDQFYTDISKRMNQRIKETYVLEFEGYLFKFWKKKIQLDYFHRVKKVAEYIIFEDFNLLVDIDDRLHILKNTNNMLIDIIPQLLEKADKPLHIDEIEHLLNIDYGICLSNKGKLRSSILRNNEIMCFSRTSTYGLKKWEIEKEMKGGTIREITKEYLEESEIPKSIYEITEYINRYRNTTPSNILGNLKMDQNNIFYFFESSLIGLTSKQYPVEYYKLKKIHVNLYKYLISFFENNDGKFNLEEAVNYLSLRSPVSKLQIKVILNNYLIRGKLKLINGKITYVSKKQN